MRTKARLAVLVLLAAAAAPVCAGASAELVAGPQRAAAGEPITFRLALDARTGASLGRTPALQIAFGDGQSLAFPIAFDPAGGLYAGSVTHAYQRPGRYTAAVTAGAAAAPLASVTVAVGGVGLRIPLARPTAAPVTPVPTPSPNRALPATFATARPATFATTRPATMTPADRAPAQPQNLHRESLQSLRFAGFTVGDLKLTATGTVVAGAGTTHVADLSVPVTFSGVTIAGMIGGSATVTAGNATAGAGRPHNAPACPLDETNAAIAGGLGTFQRFGYAFSVMSLRLGPANGKSTASLCYAPSGVETAVDPGAFNVSAQYATGALAHQLTVAIDGVSIDEKGAFASELPASAVGSYRMGRTPFTTATSTQPPLHLSFTDGSAEPHVSCAGTQVDGPILQVVYRPALHGAVTDCAWLPDGIRATLAIAPGVAFNVSEPWGYEIVVTSSALKIVKSAFLGGAMSGTFAANVNAPIPILTATLPPSPSPPGGPHANVQTYQRALVTSAQFNAAQVHANAATFQPLGGKTTQNDPSGTFGGTFDEHGDLRAAATQIGPYRTGPFVVAPSTASLFVSGGQAPHRSQDDFKNYLEGMVTNPLFDADAPQGNTSPPGGVPDGSPGLSIGKGTVKAPFATSAYGFDASSANGWGLFFSDGGGSSGAIALQSSLSATLDGFPVALTSLNALIFDGSVIRTNLRGSISLAAPISAQVPVSVQGTDASGNLLSGFIPAGTTIPLAAWGGSLTSAGPMAVTSDGIAVDGAHLSIAGYSATPAVDGKIVSSGGFSLGLLVPNPALPQARLAGLDFTPYTFSLQSSGGAAQPARIVGQGAIAGWSSSELVALVASNSGFVPAKNYTFAISRSEGSVDFDATIGYVQGGWAGRGTIAAAGLIDAPFGFRADDTSERGAIGVSVPQLDGGGAASGGSTSGFVQMANVGGAATFSRDTGAMNALAFGSDLNLSSFAGHVVMMYHTDINDPIVASFGGGKNLAARGWNCKAAWCFAGSAAMTLDSSNSVSGELDGLFDGSGFALYVDGMLNDPVVNVAVQAQLGFYSDDGEFDAGFGFTPIPILAVQFGGKVCLWNHLKGKHPATCLDTGHAETGAGFLAGGHAEVGIGDLADASVDALVWYDGSGFGGHMHGHGSVSVLGVGPTADADLNASEKPFGFSGTVMLSFCACVGSIDASVGASWYPGNSFSIDSGSLSLGGPCGACETVIEILDPLDW